jgi:Pyruvate/2-oxoacid:ferredoxin oxidoreductase delta subunit
VIVAIGQTIESLHLPEGIEMRYGRIVSDRFGRTSLPKVFAGGDVAGRKAFVADAIASGKMGAFAIHCLIEGKKIEKEFELCQIGTGENFSFQYLIEGRGNNLMDLKRVVSFEQINTLFFREGVRNDPVPLEPEIRKKGFEEVLPGLDSPRMEEEISRCFKCGTCIDCENCVDFCPDVSIFKESVSGFYRFDEDHCKGCGICFVACPRNAIELVSEKNENVPFG